jgi:isopenicillin-N epimerase
MRSAREPLAACLQDRAADVVSVPNATDGLNLVVPSLPPEPGHEVLATDHEYRVLERTWRFVCGKRGAR